MKSLSTYITEAAEMSKKEEKHWDDFIRDLRQDVENKGSGAGKATDEDCEKIFGFKQDKLKNALRKNSNDKQPLMIKGFKKEVITNEWGTDWTVIIGCVAKVEREIAGNNIWFEVVEPKKNGPNKNCYINCRPMYRIHGAGGYSGKRSYLGDDIKEFRECLNFLIEDHLWSSI